MAEVQFKVQPRQYVTPEPYIEWYSKDVHGVTRTYAPLQVQLRVQDIEGLWGRDAREIGITWDYDDVNEDFAALSHLSASEMLCDRNSNTSIRPRGAHVYRTPGTYTPTATLRDVAGNVMVLQGPEVVVTDPEAYYTDANTTYFAQDGDFTGVPVGANTVNVPDGDLSAFFADLNDFITDNDKRYLFKAGQAVDYFSTSLVKIYENNNGFIGSWGTGTMPKLSYTFMDFREGKNWVIQGVSFGSDYDPTAENAWWTGNRFGVQGVDWFADDPLPPEPQEFDIAGTENTLIDGCRMIGCRQINNNGITIGLVINDTRIENWFDYGLYQGDNAVVIGSTLAQPDGTPGRAMGSTQCDSRGRWNTTGCSNLDGVPVYNHVVHAPFRTQNVPDLFSKCYIYAGGGHSADGNTPQPALRITTSGSSLPQINAELSAYFVQCHITGTISTANRGEFYPPGDIVFDSCAFERSNSLNCQFALTYGLNVVNSIFLSRDTRTGGLFIDKFLGTDQAAGSRQNVPITEAGGNHSQIEAWFINNTFALIEDQGASVSGQAVIIQWEEWGAPNPPRYIGRNNAFFRLDSRMATSEYVPLAAPVSELDQTTFLPNAATTFDTLQDDQYMPLDFDGNVRTPADAISGFRKRTV